MIQIKHRFTGKVMDDGALEWWKENKSIIKALWEHHCK